MKKIFCVLLAVITAVVCIVTAVSVVAAPNVDSLHVIRGANVSNATSYLLYEKIGTSYILKNEGTMIDFDLDELDLSIGDHTFVVKATANGFADSDYSNEVTYTVSSGEAFAVYSATDNSLTFYKNTDTVTAGSTYKGKTATAVYTGIETSNYEADGNSPWYDYREAILSVVVADEIAPISTFRWFYGFDNCALYDVAKIDMSSCTTMDSMFCNAGYDATTLYLDLSGWDVSNVTNMDSAFRKTGYNCETVSITLSGWNTSNVTIMSNMFYQTGRSSTKLNLIGVEGFDTSSVSNMDYMFYQCGFSATYTLDLSHWSILGLSEAPVWFNRGVETKVIAPNFE